MGKRFYIRLFGVSLLSLTANVTAAITGRVIDSQGAPIKEAMVTYTNLDNRLIFTYANNEGYFKILGPNEWTIQAPGILPSTGVLGQSIIRGTTDQQSAFIMNVNGSAIHYRVTQTTPLTVDLYSVTGEKIHTVFKGKATAGDWTIDPFASIHQSCAHQLYVVRMSDGSTSQQRSILYMNHSHQRAIEGRMSIFNKSQNAPKKAAAVDTLRIGKNYYAPTKKPVDSYSSDVGEITLDDRDIEAEVTTFLDGKNRKFLGKQTVMGCNGFARDVMWGTCYWDVKQEESYHARLDTFKNVMALSASATGIGVLMANDAVHGCISPKAGTVFPHNINLGCTQNPELVELACRAVAIECQGIGLNWTFAPCIDIVRNERHGRTYEGWDEGPEGTIKYVKAAVRGFQGSDLSCPTSVAATAKHFTGAGGTQNGIHKGITNTAPYPELCKIHLPAFKAACDAGVAVVMSAFNSFKMWDGSIIKMHYNKVLMTDTLKTAWGWKGFICGDWMCAGSDKTSIANSYKAGLDNPMTPNALMPTNDAATTIVDSARIYDAARRIVRVKMLMDLKNNPTTRDYFTQYVLSDLHRAISRECVRRSLVLLKNEANVLPLKSSQKIAVVGQWANSIRYQCGGWTNGWQGDYTVADPTGTTIKDAIAKVCPNATYSVSAKGISADADVIVVAVGEIPYAEDAGDRRPPNANLNLPVPVVKGILINQTALIDSCAKTGKPVVCILLSGRPLIVTNEIAKCKAFVAAFLPGAEGDGVADLLFAVNGEKFTAKLSHTWPISNEQIPINTGAYKDTIGVRAGINGAPLFEYGFGLTYK